MSVFSIIVKSCMAKQSGIQNTNFLDKKTSLIRGFLKLENILQNSALKLKAGK